MLLLRGAGIGHSTTHKVCLMSKKEGKGPHAVALGRKGGNARMRKLAPEQRSEIAEKAARTLV
jgi:hypothetical protein